MDAPAEERVPNYGADAEASASQLRAGQPSSQTNESVRHDERHASQQYPGVQTAPAPRQHPNASGQRGTTKNPQRAPSFAEKQRYGEAVVREILGATFIEEQPYTAAPRTRNDH